jgi:hypothetical protein
MFKYFHLFIITYLYNYIKMQFINGKNTNIQKKECSI